MAKTTIEIVFFSFNSFRANLIKDFTNSNWNHVGVITSYDEQTTTVHEALDEGLVASVYDNELMQRWEEERTIEKISVEVDMTWEQFQERARAHKGKPYDWLAISLIVLFRFNVTIDNLIKKYFKIDLKLRNIAYSFSSSKQLICSEYIARLLYDVTYREMNISTHFNKPYDLLSPQDIYSYLLTYEFIQKLKNAKTVSVEKYIDKI